MVQRHRHLPLHTGGGFALGHTGNVAQGKHIGVAFVAQGVAVHLHPAIGGKGPFGPRQGAVAHSVGRAHGWHHVDEVIALLGGAGGRGVGGNAFVQINRLQHMFVLDLDAAVLEQHAHLFGHDRHTKQRLALCHVHQLGLAAVASAAQVVVADKGVFEWGACAFHFASRPAKHAHTALVGKRAQCLPSGCRRIGAVVDAAQAILANAGGVHAFNGSVVQLKARGHNQVVKSHRLAAGCHHFFAFGVYFSHRLIDPFHALGHVVAGV